MTKKLCGCASRASSFVRMRCLYHQKRSSHGQAHSLHSRDWVATALMLLLCKVGSDGSKCWEECWLVMRSFVEVCMRCIGLMSRPVPFGDGTELPLIWLTAISLQGRARWIKGWEGYWLVRRCIKEASMRWVGLTLRPIPFVVWVGLICHFSDHPLLSCKARRLDEPEGWGD